MRVLRTLPLCLFVVLIASLSAFTQTPAPAARIIEKIDDSQLVALRGNTLPVANAAHDLGRVSPGLSMTGLRLVLARSSEQQSAFDEFVSSQYDASSPNFHQWLQPVEVGERFGPSLADIATISNWLTSRGMSVSAVSKDRMTIHFSGTAGQVQSAFHTEIHNLSVRGEAHVANMSDPQIPMAIASVVTGVKGLHDFKPRPLHKLGSRASFNPDTGSWQRISDDAPAKSAGASPAASRPRPNFGINIGSGTSAYQEEDVSPYDFATIYNVLPLWNAATPINGTGQTIAVVGTSDITLSDVAAFRAAFGLPAGLTPIMVKGANGVDPGVCTGTTGNCNIEDLTENSLDVEWSGAVAPGAQIVLVTSGAKSTSDDTVYDSSDYVVQNIGVSSSPLYKAHILSLSYGLCELGEGTSGNIAYNNLWQTASAEGIAVFVATGDAGAATCDQGLDTSVPYAAQYGLSVNGIGSTPYNTAVGGTDLNWGSTASPDWNTSAGTGGATAKGYIPEVPWNDTCTNPLTLTFLQNQVQPALVNAGFNAVKPTDIETGCQFIITWYQTVYSTFGVDLSGYVDVTGGGGGVSNCTTSDGQTAASCSGGYAKPSWQTGVAGIPTDGKRDLPDVSFFASNGFLGSAYLFCVTAALPTGVATCSYPTTASTTANENLITAEEVGGTSVSTPAMAGVMALINQKAGTPQGSPNTQLYVLAAQQSYGSCKAEGPPGASCYFNDIDTGTIAMPCQPGTTNCTAIHSGDVVAVQPGYSGASGYDPATGLGSLNVANIVNAWTATPSGTGSATVTVTPSATSITVSQPLTVTVTVAGSSGTPTGTVTLVGAGYTTSAQALSAGAFTFNIPANSLAGGTDLLTVGYSGDTNYGLASGSATVTVTKLNPGGISISPGSSNFAANVALTVTGSVTAATGGPTPTGLVTLTGGGYTSSGATLANGSYSITVPSNKLTVGSDTLTASYSGDGAYNTASNTATVTVTAPPVASYSVTASTTSAISRGSSAASTISVSSTTGYAGTVAMTCALNTGGPTNQSSDTPSCSLSSSGSVSLSSTTTSGTVTATVATHAATTGALSRPTLRPNRISLAGLGLAALALLALFGIPAQRRAFRGLLGVLALVLALGSLAACGGGGSGGSGGGGGGTTTTDSGTASGTYTFTVTSTGNPAVTPAPTATFTVTVN
jgi:hypothetical protein